MIQRQAPPCGAAMPVVSRMDGPAILLITLRRDAPVGRADYPRLTT
ncbi:hypothetical protein [Falsiroseomonas oryzae]|nr:hypothetical protein [Roseomonas sp. MO-31]